MGHYILTGNRMGIDDVVDPGLSDHKPETAKAAMGNYMLTGGHFDVNDIVDSRSLGRSTGLLKDVCSICGLPTAPNPCAHVGKTVPLPYNILSDMKTVLMSKCAIEVAYQASLRRVREWLGKN
jgi:hypothetical protein